MLSLPQSDFVPTSSSMILIFLRPNGNSVHVALRWTACAAQAPQPQHAGEGSRSVSVAPGPFSCDCWRKCRNSVAGPKSGVWRGIVPDKEHEGLNIIAVPRVAEGKRAEGQMRNWRPGGRECSRALGQKQSHETRASIRGQRWSHHFLLEKGPRLGNLTDGGCYLYIILFYFFRLYLQPCHGAEKTRGVCEFLFAQNKWILWPLLLEKFKFLWYSPADFNTESALSSLSSSAFISRFPSLGHLPIYRQFKAASFLVMVSSIYLITLMLNNDCKLMINWCTNIRLTCIAFIRWWGHITKLCSAVTYWAVMMQVYYFLGAHRSRSESIFWGNGRGLEVGSSLAAAC